MVLSRGVVGVALSAGVFAVVWESFARSGVFSPALSPPLESVAVALWDMVVKGVLFKHVGYTLLRILLGLGAAALIALPIGLWMGRSRRVERFVLPLVSILSPIPSIAWVPVFILWFGLGDAAAVALVFYAATFPIILNTWTGVKSVNRIWIRAAEAMGATPPDLFRKVVLPGAMPFVIAGLRQGFARSWIAVVGGEMIAATSWGLGFAIFDAREFLNTDVMLANLFVIGVLGLAFERLVFQAIEHRTVARWGMVKKAQA